MNPRYGTPQAAFAAGVAKGSARNPRFAASLAQQAGGGAAPPPADRRMDQVEAQRGQYRSTPPAAAGPTVENPQGGLPMTYNTMTGEAVRYPNTNPTSARMPPPADRRMDQVEAQRGQVRNAAPEAAPADQAAADFAAASDSGAMAVQRDREHTYFRPAAERHRDETRAAFEAADTRREYIQARQDPYILPEVAYGATQEQLALELGREPTQPEAGGARR